MDEVYVVYSCLDQFHSRLAYGRFEAFSALAQMLFNKIPDSNSEPELFDEFISLKNDFENDHLWQSGGNFWETEFSNGFAAVVKIQSHLN